MGDADGPGDRSFYSQVLFRLLASAALGLSAVSGGYNISSAREMDLALQIRDSQMVTLSRDIERLRLAIDRIDQQGPSRGNKTLIDQIDRLHTEVRALENRLNRLEK